MSPRETYIIDTNILQIVFKFFKNATRELPLKSHEEIYQDAKNYLNSPANPTNLSKALCLNLDTNKFVMNLFLGNIPNTHLIIPSQTYNEKLFGFSSKITSQGNTYATLNKKEKAFFLDQSMVLDTLIKNGVSLEIDKTPMRYSEVPKKLNSRMEEIELTNLVIMSLEAELAEMSSILKLDSNLKWNVNKIRDILSALEIMHDLSNDLNCYKNRINDYKEYKKYLTDLENESADLENRLKKIPHIVHKQKLSESLKEYLETTDDPYINALIEDNIVLYRNSRNLNKLDDEIVNINDIAVKFALLHKNLDPLVLTPFYLNKLITEQFLPDLKNYGLSDRALTDQEAKSLVINELIERFSHNNEELDIGDFKIAHATNVVYPSKYPDDKIILLTENSKILGELAMPNLLNNLSGLKIKFPKVANIVELNSVQLNELLINGLDDSIKYIKSSYTPLLQCARTNTIIGSLEKGKELFENFIKFGDLEFIDTIKMLNSLAVENGALIIDMDKLLLNDAKNAKLILSKIKNDIFQGFIRKKSIKIGNDNATTWKKIETILNKINSTNQSFDSEIQKLLNNFYSYRDTCRKHQNFLTIGEDKELKIKLSNTPITLRALKEISKNVFDNSIEASSFKTTCHNPNIDKAINDVVGNLNTRSADSHIATLNTELANTNSPSIPLACRSTHRVIRSTISLQCIDVKSMKTSISPKTKKMKLAARLDKYDAKLGIALMLKEAMSNPDSIPIFGTAAAGFIGAQAGLHKFVSHNPKLAKILLTHIDKSLETTSLFIKSHKVNDAMKLLAQNTAISALKNAPQLLGHAVNIIWSGINIAEAAEMFASEEGQNSKTILIFTIVSEAAVITLSLAQGGALMIGGTIPGLNLVITAIVITQQLVYAIDNAVQKVNEINSKLTLTTSEKIEIFFRSLMDQSLPNNIENNLIAQSVYKQIMEKAIEDAKNNNFDVTALNLPEIAFNKTEFIERFAGLVFGAYSAGCATGIAHHVRLNGNVKESEIALKKISDDSGYTSSISRLINSIVKEQQQFICAPTKQDVDVNTHIISSCSTTKNQLGRSIHKLSLHTSEPNNNKNTCDSAVVIDVDKNTENKNILYNIEGTLTVDDPETTQMVSTIILHKNTKVTKAPLGNNNFRPIDNKWQEENVNLTGNEEYNTVQFFPGNVTAVFKPDTKINLIAVKDGHIKLNHSPNIKSLGNNTISLEGNTKENETKQILIIVGLNDKYNVNFTGSNQVIFKIDVSNNFDNDTTIFKAIDNQSSTEVIIKLDVQFICLTSLEYDEVSDELIITLTNSQKFKIQNYGNFKDTIISFDKGVFLSLNQFKGQVGDISYIHSINMNPPDTLDNAAIIEYLKKIEVSQFYERFKFRLMIDREGEQSFHGYVSNTDELKTTETKVASINYFSLGEGANNHILIKDEVDLYIVPHNTTINFANSDPCEYDVSEISHDDNQVSLKYIKTCTCNNCPINQQDALPILNIITTDNQNSFCRINFGIGKSYVLNPGQKTLIHDNAIIPNAYSISTMPLALVHKLKHKIYLPEMEAEDVRLFFDDNNELILVHPKLGQIIFIKGDKNEVQLLFKNTSNYSVYPSIDYKGLINPIEHELSVEHNPYIILSDDMPELLIIKILQNNRGVSIHHITAFTQQDNVLSLSIGGKHMTIYGWDSFKTVRPLFLFVNDVVLNLSSFDTAKIIEINQFIKTTAKLTVIEHQMGHFVNEISLLDKIATNNSDKGKLECNVFFPELSTFEQLELSRYNINTLSKAYIWWSLNKYYLLKINNSNKSQEEIIDLLKECAPFLINKRILNKLEKKAELTPEKFREIVHGFSKASSTHNKVRAFLSNKEDVDETTYDISADEVEERIVEHNGNQKDQLYIAEPLVVTSGTSSNKGLIFKLGTVGTYLLRELGSYFSGSKQDNTVSCNERTCPEEATVEGVAEDNSFTAAKASSEPSFTQAHNINQNQERPLDHTFIYTRCSDRNVKYEVSNEEGKTEIYTGLNCDITSFNPNKCKVSSNNSIKCPELILETRNCTTIKETLRDSIYAIPTQEDITSYCTTNSPTNSRGREFVNMQELNEHLESLTGLTLETQLKSSYMSNYKASAFQHTVSDSCISLVTYGIAVLYNNRKSVREKPKILSKSELQTRFSKLNSTLKKLKNLDLDQDKLQDLNEVLNALKKKNNVTNIELKAINEELTALCEYYDKISVTETKLTIWQEELLKLENIVKENFLCNKTISDLKSELNNKIGNLMDAEVIPNEFIAFLNKKQISESFIDWVKEMSIANTICKDIYDIILMLQCNQKVLCPIENAETPDSVAKLLTIFKADLEKNLPMSIYEQKAFSDGLSDIAGALNELFGVE